MKKLLAIGLLLASVVVAQAQSACTVVATCGTVPQAYAAGSTRACTVDVNGNVCTTGGSAATTVGITQGGNVAVVSTAGVLSVGSGGGDPCQGLAQSYTPISITTATTTRIVAPTAAKKTYICQLFVFSNGTNNVGIVEGTGGTCGAATAGVIGGTTAANGPNLVAQAGFSIGNGGFAVAQTVGTNVDLCLITSANQVIAGGIKWVQAP